MNLKTLDKDHPLRNAPLVEIGAYYLPKDSKIWVEVRPAYGIANSTFNQLAEVWLHDEWKATKFSEDWDNRIDIIGANGPTGDHYE
jgi:hypothetical protein